MLFSNNPTDSETAFEIAFYLQEAIKRGTHFRVRTQQGLLPGTMTLATVICNTSKAILLYRWPWDSHSNFKQFGIGWEVRLTGDSETPSILFIKTESFDEELWELIPVNG